MHSQFSQQGFACITLHASSVSAQLSGLAGRRHCPSGIGTSPIQEYKQLYRVSADHHGDTCDYPKKAASPHYVNSPGLIGGASMTPPPILGTKNTIQLCQLWLFISNSNNNNSCRSSHLKFVHNKAIPRLIYGQTEELMKRNERHCVGCRTAF